MPGDARLGSLDMMGSQLIAPSSRSIHSDVMFEGFQEASVMPLVFWRAIRLIVAH